MDQICHKYFFVPIQAVGYRMDEQVRLTDKTIKIWTRRFADRYVFSILFSYSKVKLM